MYDYNSNLIFTCNIKFIFYILNFRFYTEHYCVHYGGSCEQDRKKKLIERKLRCHRTFFVRIYIVNGYS